MASPSIHSESKEAPSLLAGRKGEVPWLNLTSSIASHKLCSQTTREHSPVTKLDCHRRDEELIFLPLFKALWSLLLQQLLL